MAEKRLIDANALTDEIEKTNWYHINKLGKLTPGANPDLHTPLFKADDIFEALEQAPTVDAVEVCRCKDCKKRSPSVNSPKNAIWCREFRAYMPCDGFCSYGEKENRWLN